MLDRALSKLGVCSRQQARAAIRAGRVLVNGKVITSHTHWVDLQHEVLHLDGQVVRAPESMRYFMLHKPRGCVTSRRDNLNRPTVFDLLPFSCKENSTKFLQSSQAHPWIFPVGRLDMDSEGLLLFTNDGQLAEALTNPQCHVQKIYQVLLNRLPSFEALIRLKKGIQLDGAFTLPAQITVEPPPTDLASGQPPVPPAQWVRISICEGKNRQVRRMFEAVGSRVRRLIRTHIGPLELGDLPVGAWRELNENEVRMLHRSVARERRQGR